MSPANQTFIQAYDFTLLVKNMDMEIIAERLKVVYKKNYELSEALSALQGELFESTTSTIIQPESTCCDCDTYTMDENGNVLRIDMSTTEPKA